MTSAAKMLFQRCAHLGDVNSCHFPDDSQVNVRVIVRYDIAHSAHFPEWKLWKSLACCLGQVGSRFSDDFNAADDSVLFLLIFGELDFGNVLHVRGDQLRRMKNILKSSDLISLHTEGSPIPECSDARRNSTIYRASDVKQSQLELPPIPRLRRPSQEVQRSKPGKRPERKSANPDRCQDLPLRAKLSRRHPNDESGVFDKRAQKPFSSCLETVDSVAALRSKLNDSSFKFKEGYGS
jgi:hypothetical protein